MSRRKIKLLILDDEKDICKFVKVLFRKKGFSVYTALTGNAAIGVIKKEKPEIALLDIYLKRGMDGLKTLRQIRKILPSCKCIMVTWDKTQKKAQEAKRLGAVSYLVKPLTVEQLLKKVSHIAKGLKSLPRQAGRGK